MNEMQVNKYWGYVYHKDCPIDLDRRSKIAELMRKHGYNPQRIEFRSTGMRYDYWKPVSCISEVSKIAPIIEDGFGDSDCGDLYYYQWT